MSSSFNLRLHLQAAQVRWFQKSSQGIVYFLSSKDSRRFRSSKGTRRSTLRCGQDQGATLTRRVCQRSLRPGGAEGGTHTSGNESFLPSSISKCELLTADIFHSYVWHESSGWKDDQVQPVGSRVLAKDPRSFLLGPGWAAVITAASCLGFVNMAGS